MEVSCSNASSANLPPRLRTKRSGAHILLWAFLLSAACSFGPVLAYDPLDPSGNITIVWDIINGDLNSYTVNVTIQNLQQLRRVEDWNLTWTWPGGEYIAQARGAEALAQGDCRALKAAGAPVHSCLKSPSMVDLPLTDKPPVPGCCKDGAIGAQLLDSVDSAAVFQIDVANTSQTPRDTFPLPQGFDLGLPGYACSQPFNVAPSTHTVPGSRHTKTSFQTSNVVCTYRKPPAKPPTCCVSFSAFYDPTIVPCRACACACGNFPKESLICNLAEDPSSGLPFLAEGRRAALESNSTAGGSSSGSTESDTQPIICSADGCPVNVRFHVKANYQGYWRAKVTIFNRHFARNFSDWVLAMQHPSMGNITEIFSFNATSVVPFDVNDTVAFWGRQGFNSWLLSANLDEGAGVVSSEILFGKGPDFTLSDGWPFPKRVSFMGTECVLPEKTPSLPNSGLQLLILPQRWVTLLLLFLIIVLITP